MMKRAMMLFLFLINILVIDIWLSSGMAFIIFYLFTIYFAVGFLGAFLHAKLRQSLLLQLINVFAAFCVGIGIYGYTKYFPNERNFIPSNPFENFLNMCPVALFIGSFGILLNFGTRKSIARLKTNWNKLH